VNKGSEAEDRAQFLVSGAGLGASFAFVTIFLVGEADSYRAGVVEVCPV
jgi:hypothetical protein